MDPRQEQLLQLVIEKHIELAEPIGSKFLVSEAGLDWSEATVRNELRALEEAGFLTHPHTSAGRIPTAQGYRHYVDYLRPEQIKLTKQQERQLADAAAQGATPEEAGKSVARTLADVAEEAVILAFSPDRVYYTGLSILFTKPEFANSEIAASVSAMFDCCEKELDEFFPAVGTNPRVFIGDEHGFGSMLSVVAVRCGKNDELLMALIGPQRMDYRRNRASLESISAVY